MWFHEKSFLCEWLAYEKDASCDLVVSAQVDYFINKVLNVKGTVRIRIFLDPYHENFKTTIEYFIPSFVSSKTKIHNFFKNFISTTQNGSGATPETKNYKSVNISPKKHLARDDNKYLSSVVQYP